MKTASLALFFFLFTFATADTVVDTDGDMLRNGGSYYVLPAFRGRGGGLTLTRVGRETCPRTVVQAYSKFDHGLPMRFSSPLFIPILTTSINLNIEFMAAPTCTPKPSMWHIPSDSELEGSIKITTNQKLRGDFQIQRASGSVYKLMYCPGLIFGSCRDLGITMDEERNMRLVVKDKDPFLVRFKKANTQGLDQWSIV